LTWVTRWGIFDIDIGLFFRLLSTRLLSRGAALLDGFLGLIAGLVATLFRAAGTGLRLAGVSSSLLDDESLSAASSSLSADTAEKCQQKLRYNQNICQQNSRKCIFMRTFSPAEGKRKC
jgi:hypothetical protein